MENTQFEKYQSIPVEKFAFAKTANSSHDEKIATKPRSYLRDAFSRFCKNKGSVVAAVIVLILFLYALIGPFFIPTSYTDAYVTDTDVQIYQYLRPRLKLFAGTGFWDGSKREKGINRATIYKYLGNDLERGQQSVREYTPREENGRTVYDAVLDTYYAIEAVEKTLTLEQYQNLQRWQDENNLQLILPAVDANKALGYGNSKSVWFVSDIGGRPELDSSGNLQAAYITYQSQSARNDAYTSSLRIASDPYLAGDTENGYSYAKLSGSSALGINYVVRLNPYYYFMYKYGFEPAFAFGTEAHGYDIFTRLASGARFSILFAIAVAVINMVIGAIYGAIEGYYGGVLDLMMERFSDILSALPSMVITVLLNLHLSGTVGPVVALLYAFILTGWIGMASTVRMQFYRFKNQEYVLASRTLGANDWRVMWKHIFPNSLGTIITSSVLIIPGVIFSETSLTYLGIINLDSPTQASIGAMLSAGQAQLTVFPHIIMFPALFLALLEISFNLFGNGLRDAFNPTLRGSEG